MFIELTDHLRCPADHPEQFLILLPDRMDGRRVVTGDLGCPVCGLVVRLADGVADWGDAPEATGETGLTADAVAAFMGLSGPGGYVALVGNAAALAGELAEVLSGIRLILVNPAPDTPDSDSGSVLRAVRLPIKAGSLRGIVVGSDLAGRQEWLDAAAGAVLPGLRIVSESELEPAGNVELLARAGGVSVYRRIM